MKVNRITGHEWTEYLGLCDELPVPGHAVAVQVTKHPDILFTILHESVHVWQAICKYMGEDNPGIEAEAYTIEYIAKELMLQYQKATGESLAVNSRVVKQARKPREVTYLKGEVAGEE